MRVDALFDHAPHPLSFPSTTTIPTSPITPHRAISSIQTGRLIATLETRYRYCSAVSRQPPAHRTLFTHLQSGFAAPSL
jgi:hypothetical protein